jgi:hypothetical protein
MKTSIVIRGNNSSGHTQTVIDSIRNWYSGELILSTWLNEDTSKLKGLSFAILNEDPGPGPMFDSPDKHVQNAYRQLISGLKGIIHSSGDLILVIRSDTTINKDIFNFFDDPNFSKTTDSFKIFSKKIVIGNMMSINPDKNHEPFAERAFRVGDWFHMGDKNDLIRYFGSYDYIHNGKNPKHIGVEQNWLGAAIKKYYKKDLDLLNLDQYHQHAWDIILNNFRIINNYTTAKSFCLKKDWINQPENLPAYLSQNEYELKYKEKFN